MTLKEAQALTSPFVRWQSKFATAHPVTLATDVARIALAMAARKHSARSAAGPATRLRRESQSRPSSRRSDGAATSARRHRSSPASPLHHAAALARFAHGSGADHDEFFDQRCSVQIDASE
jgi:hypothetical protein